MNPKAEAIAGCLIGMAVGDALGLPRERLSPRRSARLFPDFDRFHFLFGKGMFSDDTEHACMTGQALLVSGGDPQRFISSLAWRLRWWLLGLPFSAGKATLLGCIKLWLGCNPRHSGVWSAGNGPAMRAPILGVCFGDQPQRLQQLIRLSTRITHRDPKAEWGALAVAQAAWIAALSRDKALTPADIARGIVEALPAEAGELIALIERAVKSVELGKSTAAFSIDLGLGDGVTGYMLHTVPVVLHTWMSFPNDYASAVQAVIRCGGDADTTAAIVGGIAGARPGKDGIPEHWRRSLCEWPRDLRWIERLGRELAQMVETGELRRGVPLSLFGMVARNLLFDGVVLLHACRRLLPPY
jgi:ADP-ribosyl-[dinitrogen reductase] hydrolase